MRTRSNYGIVGATQTLALSSTGGVYNADDQRIAKAAGKWPLLMPVLTINGITTNIGTLSPNFQLSKTANGFYTLSSDIESSFRIQLWGGGGGTGQSSTPGQGGAGGYVEGTIILQASTSYIFLVGAGGAQSGNSRTFPDGGFGSGSSVGGAGGGSSRFGLQGSITNSANSYNNSSATYFLIAGGGGGSTNWAAATTGHTVEAGYGGGTTGAGGGVYYSADGVQTLGGGATQSAGGTAGSAGRQPAGSAGGKYAGGDGYGCGGGGGYYGGGGAGGYYSQSGGGSGYIDSGNVSSGTFYTASTGDNNYLSPNPRTNKPTNAGNGGLLTAGIDGAIILTWLG